MHRFKYSHKLPTSFGKVNQEILKNKRGQTIVECVLLLASITIISFGTLRIVNTNIADRWERIANIILEDPDQTLRVK